MRRRPDKETSLFKLSGHLGRLLNSNKVCSIAVMKGCSRIHVFKNKSVLTSTGL